MSLEIERYGRAVSRREVVAERPRTGRRDKDVWLRRPDLNVAALFGDSIDRNGNSCRSSASRHALSRH